MERDFEEEFERSLRETTLKQGSVVEGFGKEMILGQRF
jgi:hypothetical protein